MHSYCEQSLEKCENALNRGFEHQFYLLVTLVISASVHLACGLFSLKRQPACVATRSSQTDEDDTVIPYIVINPGDHVQMAFTPSH